MEVEPSQFPKPIRVLLIDDHAMVRAGLRLLLEKITHIRVVGEADNMTDALAITSREQPDIILLDLVMSSESGLDYLPKLLTLSRESRIIILTGVNDPKLHQRAVQLGAMGLLLKDKAPEILIKAIEKVATGEAWLDRVTMANVLAELSRPNKTDASSEEAKVASLTKREREIISLVALGMKNKQIAERLLISEITVRHHLTSVFSKLDLSDRFELIIYAFRHGLAESPP